MTDKDQLPPLPEPAAPAAPVAPVAAVPDDGLISKDRFYGDDHIQDIAHALAQECEAAELDPNDYVTINREKLTAIAKRVLEKASEMLASPTPPVQPAARAPFNTAQRKRLWLNSPEHHKDAASFTGFERIVTLTERPHLIGSITSNGEA